MQYLELPVCALLLAAACTTGASDSPAPTASPSANRAVDLNVHVEDDPGIRFPLPSGIGIQTWHYDRTLPPQKFRHAIHLETPHGITILIHVWDNPEHLDVHAWFDANMAGFVQPTTALRDRIMSSAKVPGILLEEPASEQAVSQAIGVFVAEDHVFSVTALDPTGDETTRRLFERELDELEPQVSP
ncbi:hypothetical protein BH09MYX1_BH09MYX1_66290 [soil metagenome]